ncbi:hypothetical protein D9615_008156 [Tricholomella constricta]|uniref:N-acetyltransferase domain-containing protein n=1 Tax=Tricholomella constricta TaxID=117010 RepID=A0A8H5H3N1_9AGAR|nr:hypothetical protein D9615_008156 [Tricholomella constricta]
MRSADGAFAGVIGYLKGSDQNLMVELALVLISPSFQRTDMTPKTIELLLHYARWNLPDAGRPGLCRDV